MGKGLSNDRQKQPPEALSVTEFTSRVKEHVESRFADAWVCGEISNLVAASSGHVYLSLKDDTSLLRAVIWRGTRQLLAIEPSDGLEVICHGRLEVYPPRGTYQLTIDALHAIGTGALEARLRKLHASLESEGLFAAERKRPIPTFPRRIALVTSPSGAAIADFLKTLFLRWRATEVIVVPSRVQGAGAAEELAAALATAARIRPAVDVIALVRGGGSLEDLWVQVVAMTDSLGIRLQASLKRSLRATRDRIDHLARAPIFADPNKVVRDRDSLVQQHAARLNRLVNTAIQRGRERLGAAVGRLEAGSPLKLLSRGYSVTSLAENYGKHGSTALRSTAGIDPEAIIVTHLADGRLWSRVERITNDADKD